MKNFLGIALFLAFTIGYKTDAQTIALTGTIVDKADNSPLVGVTVLLIHPKDSNKKQGAVTDMEGRFEIDKLTAGSYNLKASYLGYQSFSSTLKLEKATNLGTIKLTSTTKELQATTIKAQQIAAQQSGDTTNFNAGAYKTNPDATAEDLIKKMPGITTEGGTIKSNGEEVKKVLVDGKPFFGDDPNATIKNLPADIIDKIQVFDKLSDQSQLTGFDDGQGVKAINIVTKKGKKNGRFGKVYAGYGKKMNS